MNKELPARVFGRAKASDIGLAIKEDAPESDKRQAVQTLADVDRYLQDFCVSKKCIVCGSTLTGLFGSFEWGIAHGEGYCSNCGYPARAYHTVNDREHKPIFEHAAFVLQYHPEVLADRDGRRISLERLAEVFKPRSEVVW